VIKRLTKNTKLKKLSRDSLRQLRYLHLNVQLGERRANDARKLSALRDYDERHNPKYFHLLTDGYTVMKGMKYIQYIYIYIYTVLGVRADGEQRCAAPRFLHAFFTRLLPHD